MENGRPLSVGVPILFSLGWSAMERGHSLGGAESGPVSYFLTVSRLVPFSTALMWMDPLWL